jgi:hypothetical protein
MRHYIGPVKEEHIIQLKDNMQSIAQMSCWDLTNHTPEEAIRSSLKESNESNVWTADDKVMGIFGVAVHTLVSTHGYPWFLGANGLEQYRISFVKGTRLWLDRVKSRYDYLYTYIDARNTSSVSWLKHMGFTVHPPKPFGKENMLFHTAEFGVK